MGKSNLQGNAKVAHDDGYYSTTLDDHHWILHA